MKNLIFIVFSAFCMAQTDQYKEILLSKQIGKKVDSYRNGYGTFHVYKSEAGIVDSLGNITYVAPKYGYISHIQKNRFILYIEEKNHNRKEGIIDEKGNQIIAPDYYDFYNPWVNNTIFIVAKKNQKSVYDFNGNQIIPYFDDIYFADDEKLLVKKSKDWFIYDFNGNQISDRGFSDYFYFINGKSLITNKFGKSEIVDTNGKTLHTFSKYFVCDIGYYPILKTKNIQKNKFGLIDVNENSIADEVYDDVLIPFKNPAEYIYLEKNKKKSIFNSKDYEIYQTNETSVRHLFEDYFSTYNEKTQKYGIIKITGENIFTQEYNYMTSFSVGNENVLYMEKGKEQVFLDENLKPVFSSEYKIISINPNTVFLKKDNQYFKVGFPEKTITELSNINFIKEEHLYFYNPIYPYSLPPICKNSENLYGIINEKGTVIIPFIYDEIIRFANSENQLVVRKGKKYGVTNYENEPLTEIEFDNYAWKKEVLELKKGNKTEFLNFTRIDYRNLHDK